MIDKDMNSACMRGGSIRTLNNYQQMLEPRSPHTAWQFGVSQIVKREPMDEDKNDSGVTSGSDFHSSSPSSDTSQDLQHSYQSPQTQPTRFYSTPIVPHFAYNHNPLTPPNSEPLVSPKSEKEEKDMETTLTPCASPSRKPEENQDHLRRLEMSLEKSGLFSSKTSEHSVDELSGKSDNDAEEYDEQSLRVPKVNSHGKIKTFKCKQCDFVAITKLEQWNHSKVHIREDKRLTCPKCPFITEYKHHLEYHLRNHAGSKPFQCNKCDYTCVNKSMLNSHMKSHSNVYRYSCRDCSYATKYCHSLKIHLRRYGHTPNVVLDEEGNPCPDIIIDVHGTRRGPKIKTQPKAEESKPETLPFLNLQQQLPFPGYPFFGGFPNAQLLQQLIRERQLASGGPPEESRVLDLSKPGCSYGGEQKSRRKGPAFKVDPAQVESEEEDEETSTTVFSNVEVVQEEAKKEESEVADSNNNKEEGNNCQYCNIAFGDAVLYTIHMGYHGFHNPFTCNMCGVECSDKVSFFLHIARVSHS
ncbi:protein hunchback [Tribolium madens]|uniref:protein hunchback n=1 Tax=Tribolium madens TaxID=41895 RepID=UPI001CF72CD2|nr:protein hunchback [Tribolium madens]XP_044266346.1 protein hunchback [Tribolium madens]